MSKAVLLTLLYFIAFEEVMLSLATYFCFYFVFRSYTLLRNLLSYFENIRCLINIPLLFWDPKTGLLL